MIEIRDEQAEAIQRLARAAIDAAEGIEQRSKRYPDGMLSPELLPLAARLRDAVRHVNEMARVWPAFAAPTSSDKGNTNLKQGEQS